MKISNFGQMKAHTKHVQLHSPLAPKAKFKYKDEKGKEQEADHPTAFAKPVPEEFLYTGPDGKPLTIEIVGFQSERMRQATLEQRRKIVSATPDELGDPGFKLSTDLRLLSQLIVGWSHPDVLGEYSPDRAFEIVSDGDAAYIVSILEAAIAESESFFKH